MEETQESLLPKFIIHDDITEADKLQPKMCPNCKSALHLYQIHFDEKLLMCCREDCHYPFDSTEIHFYKNECNEEVIRPESRNSAGASSATSGSMTSYTDWSEIERFIHTSPYSPASTPPRSLIEEPLDMEKLTKLKESIEKDQKLRKDVQTIKQLNKKLCDPNEEMEIENKVWIKQIAEMQERSGVHVLKKHELQKIKPVVPKINASDVKINVDTSQNIISLKIGIDDQMDESSG